MYKSDARVSVHKEGSRKYLSFYSCVLSRAKTEMSNNSSVLIIDPSLDKLVWIQPLQREYCAVKQSKSTFQAHSQYFSEGGAGQVHVKMNEID